MLEEVFIAVWPCFVAGKATLDCLESLSSAHTNKKTHWVSKINRVK